MPLPKTVEFIHSLLESHLEEGGRAVDATMGNGHDTVLLARLVGDTGMVFAFDVQPLALMATERALVADNLQHRVKLIQDSHSRLPDYVTEDVNAIVFNLGYLPGADKSLATQVDETLLAVKQALTLLAPGGLLLVAVYPGHPAGLLESEQLDPFTASLNPSAYRVLKYQFTNRKKPAPYLLAIERLAE